MLLWWFPSYISDFHKSYWLENYWKRQFGEVLNLNKRLEKILKIRKNKLKQMVHCNKEAPYPQTSS